jgi:WD40 repeat protein
MREPQSDLRHTGRMHAFTTAAAAILFALTLVFAGGARAQQKCPVPPTLSAPTGTNIFNTQQELDLGDVEAEWLEKNYRVIHDDELAARLNRTSSRILAQLPPTQLKFRIILIDMPVVNSFSNGAGRIYVTRKMIAFVRNDDELAGLIGHEMGHMLTHQNAILSTREFHDILGVNTVTNRKDIFDKYNRLLDNFARDRNVLVKALERMQREEEPNQYEADRVALYAVTAAGYSPQAFVEFFDRLAATHGKTGNVVSDFFGTTKPDEKRLREIHKSLSSLPQVCRDIAPTAASAEFLAWQSDVIAYTGSGRKEDLVGTVSKTPLEPPLRTDVQNLKFSPDGEYSLAQDDASIFVFENDPFELLFRIDAAEAHHAQFSPDSKKILFLTQGLRVEEWNIDDAERTSVHELALPEGCLSSTLSHDGKLLACVNQHLDLSLIDVASGTAVLTEKECFEPKHFGRNGDISRMLVYLWAEIGYAQWIRMAFSPDDQYFAATGANTAIAINARDRAKISLRGELSEMLTANFAFLGADRILVQNMFDPKNSAVIEFATGKVVERIPISPRQSMEAPTRGNYVILRPVKDAQVGLLDLATQNFVIGSTKSPVMDVFDKEVLMQKSSGEVGIFDFVNHEHKGEVELPMSSLGTLQAWAVSPDLRWLAASGASRGAVWDLSSSKRLYYTRGFRGVYFDGNQALFADFPKQDPQARTIARADLSRENMAPALPIDEKTAVQQHGQYLLLRKPAGKENTLARDVTLEIQDVRDGHVLWSRTFPKEAPSISLYPQSASLVFTWSVDSPAAKDEIKGSGSLQSRFAAMQDHKGAYLMEVVEAATGNSRGQLLIDTGKGSFRVTRCFAESDWVLVGDNENRTRVYSLSTGEQKAILFGSYSMVSTAAGILVVENEAGQIDVYDLKSLEKRNLLTFPYRVSAWSFSSDGKRLFVLTANQVAYVFDSQALDKTESTVAGGS